MAPLRVAENSGNRIVPADAGLLIRPTVERTAESIREKAFYLPKKGDSL